MKIAIKSIEFYCTGITLDLKQLGVCNVAGWFITVHSHKVN